jgi:calcineurin-like phosphoesterase family protein
MSEPPSRIVFISDLHFDFTRGKRKVRAARQMQEDFIAFAKQHLADDILCIAGDIYNSSEKTLAFLKALEKEGIEGFFVLGNHDYWNDGTRSHQEIIEQFLEETASNRCFRFLATGRQYYCGDICVIGDTGWTSFRRGKRKVNLRQFAQLPDAKLVRDFSPRSVAALHSEWVSFAQSTLDREARVLMLTHFPMFDLTKEDKDCWWSSTTALEGENCWRIFGHTHVATQREYNNVARQRGYANRAIEELKRAACQRRFEETRPWNRQEMLADYRAQRDSYVEENWAVAEPENQYCLRDFGILEKVSESLDIVSDGGLARLPGFYSAIGPSWDVDEDLKRKISQRGYRRSSWNLGNLAALANDPQGYLEIVREVVKSLERNVYIGYCHGSDTPDRVVSAIEQSIVILEDRDFSDLRSFVTAAVITGYAFNGLPFLIRKMRPVDDVDVVRFCMVFLTIQSFSLDFGRIAGVRRAQGRSIFLGNVELPLPTIDGCCLDVDDMVAWMRDRGLPAELSPGRIGRGLPQA